MANRPREIQGAGNSVEFADELEQLCGILLSLLLADQVPEQLCLLVSCGRDAGYIPVDHEEHGLLEDVLVVEMEWP